MYIIHMYIMHIKYIICIYYIHVYMLYTRTLYNITVNSGSFFLLGTLTLNFGPSKKKLPGLLEIFNLGSFLADRDYPLKCIRALFLTALQ
jgi:hypothetical protein